MKSQSTSPKMLMIILLASFVFLVGFEGIRQQSASVSGTIEKVEKNHQSVTVNGQKLTIIPGTKIIDEKGNALKNVELKENHAVEVQGFRSKYGFTATKIMVKSMKKNP